MDVTDVISRRLANYKLSDETVKQLADRVVVDGLELSSFFPCIYGICVDYHTTEFPRLDVIRDRRITKWEVFPYGIIDWDRFHVRVAFEVDELEGKVRTRGFGH